MLKVFQLFSIPTTKLPFFKAYLCGRLFSFKCALSNDSTHRIHSFFPFPSGFRQYSDGNDFFLTGKAFVAVRVSVSINRVNDQKQLKNNRQQTNWYN